MAETTYKKGELLFEESITTNNSDDLNTAYCQTEMVLNQDVLIIEFDNIEYTCEAFRMEGWPISCYGGISAQGPDFSFFPFALNNTMNAGAQTSTIWLGTKNPGTYSLKVYTAVEDSDSNIDNEPLTIRGYITKNLPSLNWNILPQIFAENGVEMNEEIEAYLRNTPENTNWSILEQLGESGSGSEIELPAKLICIDGVYTGQLPEGSSWKTTAEAFNWIKQHGDSSGSFAVIDISVVALIDSQGQPFDGKDSGTGRIFDDIIVWSTRNYSIELNQNVLAVSYQD